MCMSLDTNLIQNIDGDTEVTVGIYVQYMSCVKTLLKFDLQII